MIWQRLVNNRERKKANVMKQILLFLHSHRAWSLVVHCFIRLRWNEFQYNRSFFSFVLCQMEPNLKVIWIYQFRGKCKIGWNDQDLCTRKFATWHLFQERRASVEVEIEHVEHIWTTDREFVWVAQKSSLITFRTYYKHSKAMLAVLMSVLPSFFET